MKINTASFLINNTLVKSSWLTNATPPQAQMITCPLTSAKMRSLLSYLPSEKPP